MYGEICYALVFLVEALIASYYYGRIFSAKRRGTLRLLHYLLGYAILFAASHAQSPAVNMSCYFAVNFAILFWDYSCKLRGAVMHTAILTILMMFTELIADLILGLFHVDFAAYREDIYALVALMASSKTLFFFTVTVAVRIFAPQRVNRRISGMAVLLSLLPILFAAVALFFVYVGHTGAFDGASRSIMAVSVLAMLFITIVVLVLYHRFQQQDEERISRQISDLRAQADAEYYEMLQQQNESQRVLIHDIKNHLGVIASMAAENGDKAITAYVSELEKLPALQKKSRFCADPILNMILIRYAEDCAANGINFSCDIRADSIDFLVPTDTTALFGNLLSNAVEAAVKSEGKTVEISVSNSSGGIVAILSVVNSCDAAPLTDENGDLISSKETNGEHGYGTKSIERVVKKYGGTQTSYFDAGQKMFHSVIQFPIENKSE